MSCNRFLELFDPYRDLQFTYERPKDETLCNEIQAEADKKLKEATDLLSKVQEMRRAMGSKKYPDHAAYLERKMQERVRTEKMAQSVLDQVSPAYKDVLRQDLLANACPFRPSQQQSGDFFVGELVGYIVPRNIGIRQYPACSCIAAIIVSVSEDDHYWVALSAETDDEMEEPYMLRYANYNSLMKCERWK